MTENNKEENKTKSNLKTISQCKREIELEVPSKVVNEEFQKIISQFSSRAKIHGFRPGKAPKELVKSMFYSEIERSLLDSILPKVLNEELKTLNLNLINVPIVKDLHFKEGEPLRFKAYFEIWPDFKLPVYKKVRIKKKEVTVTEEELNQYLSTLQQRSAEYIPIEGRGVVDGDYVLVEIKGKDLELNKFLPNEKVLIKAGHPDNEKLLNENLLGLKVAEERKFVLNYDQNYQNKKLAGKKIEYNLKVISIKEKNLPRLDDDFAKELGEYDKLDDLKEKLKKEIQISKENAAKREIAEEIIENISDNLNVELPETLVEEENLSLLKHRLSQLPQKEFKKEDIKALKEEGKKQAEKNLKNHLILKKIAEVEGFKVSEEEENQELKAIAKANNIPLAKVIDSINKEGRKEELRNNILFKKTVDFLVEKAIIK